MFRNAAARLRLARALTVEAAPPATTAQLAFIARLEARLGRPVEMRHRLSVAEASGLIDRLLAECDTVTRP